MSKGARKAKAKKSGNATRTTTPPKGAAKVGTTVVYLGGSRCKWLKKGMTGTIVRYFVNPGGHSFRYGIAVEVAGKKKSTQVATKYVQAPR